MPRIRNRDVDGFMQDEKGDVNEFWSYTVPLLSTLVCTIAVLVVTSISLGFEMDVHKHIDALVSGSYVDQNSAVVVSCEFNNDWTIENREPTSSDYYYIDNSGALMPNHNADKSKLEGCELAVYNEMLLLKNPHSGRRLQQQQSMTGSKAIKHGSDSTNEHCQATAVTHVSSSQHALKSFQRGKGDKSVVSNGKCKDGLETREPFWKKIINPVENRVPKIVKGLKDDFDKVRDDVRDKLK